MRRESASLAVRAHARLQQRSAERVRQPAAAQPGVTDAAIPLEIAMKTVGSTSLRALVCGIALFGGMSAAHAVVGARVIVQQWKPTAPDVQTTTATEDPSAVSDAVQAAWNEARPRICNALYLAMGKGGAAAGQTLHDIVCVLDEHATLEVARSGPAALSAQLAISGYVETSSTTPTIVDGAVDPRFSVALTARLLLAISVQPTRDQTLRIDQAQFKLSNATLDSHNLSGDLLKFVGEDLSPYFGGPNYKRLAEGAIDSIGVDLTALFNRALAPVNAKLRGPSDMVRLGVWGRPDAITVAFGPRELVPPLGGTMFGVMRWDSSKMPAGTCEKLRIDATVQTGPAPLRDPGGYYEPGDAPRRGVGSFQRLPSTAGADCRYRLSGIAVGWPNSLNAATLDGNKSAGNSIHSTRYTLVGDGWDGRTVIAQPSIERNYVIRGEIEATAVVDPAATLKHGAVNPADPRIQVADRLATEATTRPQGATIGQGKAAPTGKATPAFGAAKPRATNADAVTLNPQPLPPDPDPTSPARSQSAFRPAGR
jgi:hypothetical protein